MGEFEILNLFLFAFIFFLSARNTKFFNGTGNVEVDVVSDFEDKFWDSKKQSQVAVPFRF